MLEVLTDSFPNNYDLVDALYSFEEDLVPLQPEECYLLIIKNDFQSFKLLTYGPQIRREELVGRAPLG